jgi:hypothetical protein
MRTLKELDETNGTGYHRRFLDYMKWYQKNDKLARYLAEIIANPDASALLNQKTAWGDQSK